MSDLTTKDRYSFDSISTGRLTMQNVALPKSQPVRLKELMQMCEDDDDDDEDNANDEDDDDDDDENFDEPRPLSQNIGEDTFEEAPPCKSSNPPIDSMDGFPNSACTLPEGNCESVSYTQKRISCTSDKEEYRVNGVNFGSQLPVSSTSKQETYNCKYDVQKQDNNISHHALRGHQVDTVRDCSMGVASSPPSLSIFTGDYSAKPDTNRNLPSTSSVQLLHENAYAPDMLKRREEYPYNVSAESKTLLSRASDTYLSHISKEEQWLKGTHSFTEQTSKDREEESQTLKGPSTAAESLSGVPQTFGSSMHPMRHSSQFGVARYEANERYTPAKSSHAEFSTPSLSEKTGKSLTTANRLVLDTPMKHLQISSMHPNSCMSHKQLFCTPQNKMSGDASKSHVQTPSTILSTWCHNNVRSIQAEGKNLFAREHVQTPRNTICTPIAEKAEPSSFSGIDRPYRNVRRPLVDAALAHGDTLSYPVESKTPLLHTRPEAKSIATSEAQQENRNRKTVGTVELHSDLKPTKLVEEMKDKQCVPNASVGSDGRAMQSQNESNQLTVGVNTSAKVVQDSSRKYKEQGSSVPSVEHASVHEHYPVRERHYPVREEVRQIADKVASVQFSVPTSLLPQRQSGKTLFVKDKEYLILGSLGRGMSGEVLRVQDLSSGEMLAIKCVDLSKMDKEAAQGCLDEITMLHKLQAPCVIKMFDYHIRESMVYVIMEMGDTDLSRLLRSMSQEKQIPFTMILYYWTEMLTAVKHIHDNGVIHSDLKPGNYLLVRGRLKLIDFGIASSINSEMTSVLKNNTIGTLNYISPEALMDIGGNADSPTHKVKYKINFKSDVWSLGCILYSMVYGQTPFHHIRSQWAKVNAITNPKPNISFPVTRSTSGGDAKNCEHIPPVLIDVMRKCLQHDPKMRSTVSQLLQVQYLPTSQHATLTSVVPDIPANVLVKIKRTLNEDEWRQFIQVSDHRLFSR
ncbi:Dual specificity protein kinase Ttk [Ooceraea biroi]|uniref:Dual specificity protein kinase Ttk n=1 Tax=Ooceraea biroi TaxID=2015173 RepID=A0A026WDQ5_OOCBI|nr:Dual specificity protein kinase Ttk [Ooceraea biroi]